MGSERLWWLAGKEHCSKGQRASSYTELSLHPQRSSLALLFDEIGRSAEKEQPQDLGGNTRPNHLIMLSTSDRSRPGNVAKMILFRQLFR